MLFTHGKEFDHENETVDSACGIAALLLSLCGHRRGVLSKFRMLPGWLLRRKLLHERGQLRLRLRLLPVTKAAYRARANL